MKYTVDCYLKDKHEGSERKMSFEIDVDDVDEIAHAAGNYIRDNRLIGETIIETDWYEAEVSNKEGE